MTDNKTRIDRILNKDENSADTSLRAKSLQRATRGTVPKTLTPYEWEQWYSEHGIPGTHLQPTQKRASPWWKKWFS